jgi:alanyl-tRNA synthetase
VGALVDTLGGAYPELCSQQKQIEKILLLEEPQFEKTLEKGLSVLESVLASPDFTQSGSTQIPGATVFALYDTYGFPTDLTNDIAREHELTLDMEGYEKCMNEQRARARAAGKFTVDYSSTIVLDGATDFTGYDAVNGEGAIVALYQDVQSVESLKQGDEGVIVLSSTAFYAESGGQVGDTGYITAGDNRFEVQDCQKNGSHHLHIGKVLSGEFSCGATAVTQVDSQVRQATILNHSATHLMHAALRKVLGEHVVQKGSLVDSEKLRFDFSHIQAVSAHELEQIQTIVNDEIRRNSSVTVDHCDIEQAKSKGAMMLFDEKYGDEVRVLSMGDGFSIELCGGVHVNRTGDIGVFHIAAESGIASGVRRIEAVTGHKALTRLLSYKESIEVIAHSVKANTANAVEKVEQLAAQVKEQEKAMAAMQSKLASADSGALLKQVKLLGGINLLAHHIEGANGKVLRDMADALKSQVDNTVFILVTNEGSKVSIITGVTKDLTARFKAGDLMREVAPLVGGKGGGRPDMAQGGGTDPAGIPALLKAAEQWVQK